MLQRVYEGIWVPREYRVQWSPTGPGSFAQEGALVPRVQEPVLVRWRCLTFAEHRTLTGRTPALSAWFNAYETCRIEGPPLDRVPFGIPAWIGRHVIQSSPFNQELQTINQALLDARKQVSSDYFLATKAIVSSVFHYPLETIEQWTPDVFFERLAQAELILNKQFNPGDPRSRQQKSEQQARRKPRGITWGQEIESSGSAK